MSGIKDYAESLRKRRFQSQQPYVPAAIYEATSGNPSNTTYVQPRADQSPRVTRTGVHEIPSHWFSR